MSGYCHAISNGADKFEVKHWDHRFTVDLQAKTCSCRYWQLSGMSCCHAISSIYFISNSLDAYIADCYSVENLRKSYMHCLEPVESQDSWPTSDRPKLRAPGYNKMPGRSKTQRTREPHEKPKATKMSRVGTVNNVQSANILATIEALVTKGVPLPHLVVLHLVLLLEA